MLSRVVLPVVLVACLGGCVSQGTYNQEVQQANTYATQSRTYQALSAQLQKEIQADQVRIKEPVSYTHLDVYKRQVDLSAVAARLTSLIGQEPAGRAPDLGGPRVERFTDLAQQWQHHIDRKRRVVPVRLPGRTFAAYAQGGHLAPEGAATATPTFAAFLGAGTV